jgi:predicted nucleotidyltransferase
MISTVSLALDAEQMAIIRAILAAHLPQNARVLVFGSRATGRARPFSDLNLALVSDAFRAIIEANCLDLTQEEMRLDRAGIIP